MLMKQNGAMKVIPGSHKKDALKHNLIEDKNLTLNRELPIENVDQKSAQFIELKAGQVSVHDIGIIHSSGANFSGRRRAGLALWVYAVYFVYEPNYAECLGKLERYAYGVSKR